MLSKDQSAPLLPEYEQLSALFEQAGAICSPAEFHGVLCGYLAAGSRHTSDAWMQVAAEEMEVAAITEQALAESLSQLYKVSLQLLAGSGFEFVLLTPADNVPMSLRSTALGQWCHGFLGGYGMAGGMVEGKLSDEAVDAMQDLVQIAQIAAQSEVDDDGDEADFTEVYEYVRMSAMLIFSECNAAPEPQGAPASERLH